MYRLCAHRKGLCVRGGGVLEASAFIESANTHPSVRLFSASVLPLTHRSEKIESTDAPFGNSDSTDTPFGNSDSTDTPFGNPESTDTPFGNSESTDTPFGNSESTDAAFGFYRISSMRQ